jgi:hypothetical protein
METISVLFYVVTIEKFLTLAYVVSVVSTVLIPFDAAYAI